MNSRTFLLGNIPNTSHVFRRAQMLRDAIKDQPLPKQGDPCAPQKCLSPSIVPYGGRASSVPVGHDFLTYFIL